MKITPKKKVSDQLDAQIKLAARLGPPPTWLEDRIREALTEPSEVTNKKKFSKAMVAIARGR